MRAEEPGTGMEVEEPEEEPDGAFNGEENVLASGGKGVALLSCLVRGSLVS